MYILTNCKPEFLASSYKKNVFYYILVHVHIRILTFITSFISSTSPYALLLPKAAEAKKTLQKYLLICSKPKKVYHANKIYLKPTQ